MQHTCCPNCACERCKARAACCAACGLPMANCRCHAAPPAHACGSGGDYLLPKIVCFGREWVRNFEACLPLADIPCDAHPPFTLCRVCAAPVPPDWQEEPPAACDPKGLVLSVHIPLDITLRDGADCLHAARSDLWVRVRGRLRCPREECWRYRWVVVPAVRLARAPAPTCGNEAPVCLEVCVEAYLVRPEPVCRQDCHPVCPPIPPLYPSLPF
ncbi:MAG: hypothetical protein LBU67_02260 [Oscillospiraceae bacterium]|jgi:hypothetical protein|nr:hypothetical protein [Oscillospiraceae bacterium]